MTAALKGDLAIVQYLAEHGALLQLTTKDGRTPLHMAVQEGHDSVAIYLASQYPDSMYMTTKSGRLPVQMAAANGDATLVRSLLSLTDDNKDVISHQDRSGRTILEDAVVANQLDLVSWLIQTYQAADPTRHDALGRNIWHHAAMMGHVAMLQLLGQWLNLRSSLNDVDAWDTWTPLMYAAKNGHLDCVRYLVVDLQVDTTRKDKLGRTAKDLGKNPSPSKL
ncbi:ankyrin repeat-containing domain protein [Chlamydoabsidia padenii]|nr:ankyrin repeat-containing domain protein [Chlamydoabsidia padenii]